MEHWPGHEKHEKKQITDKSKDQSKQKEHRRESDFWQWPHLEHGTVGRTILVSKNGRVHWSSVVDTSYDARWLPLGRLTKVFPETRTPLVDIHENSACLRVEKGLQYLRTYFPDANFPGELLGNTLEEEAKEMRRLKAFDPLLGNLLEIMSSHHAEHESTVLFPMGELGSELNISRLSLDNLGNMVFIPAGSPSFSFETPILQISSAVRPPEWTAAPYCTFLIRTHTSSSLLRLEHSKVTRELDITRSEAGDVPIVDSRILATGPDIVVVNRSGKVYKCNTYHGGKAMQSIRVNEVTTSNDFWQLGITRRNDECFLASYKAVKHIDFRSASSFVDVFSLDHPSAVVTSFESPMHNYISRITTTSDVVWLDDRFRRRPLLSYKHYRSFDRTLSVLTANLYGGSLSLLTSRNNSLVTVYDVSRGSDGLFHCHSIPSCLPHDGSIFRTFHGHAIAALPSNNELTFLRLCQCGSMHRQDIRVVQPNEDQPTIEGRHITHRWDEDVQMLAEKAEKLEIDFGPAGGRHYTEVNLRDAYEKIFAMRSGTQADSHQDTVEDTIARSLEVWKNAEESGDSMLTMFDVISGIEDESGHTSQTDFLAVNVNLKQAFDALMDGRLATKEFVGLARWHYNIQDTSIPAFDYHCVNSNTLHERLKELSLEFGAGRHSIAVQRETEAREELVLDLALSNDICSSRPVGKLRSSAAGAKALSPQLSFSEEPPEVEFGYFRPVRKVGADHYAEKEDAGVSSPLGVRLLLAEWEPGTDPNDYAYRDPYGVVDTDALHPPQYRKPPAVPPATQKKQMQPQQPPPVVAATTQPIGIHTVERAPPMVQSQNMQQIHSQQQFEFDAFSQEPVTSTQVLPGPFGGRPGAGKRPTKKRMGGF